MNDYHLFYRFTDFYLFRERCNNFYFLGLRLHILREKLKLFVKSKIDSFRSESRRKSVPVTDGLIRAESCNAVRAIPLASIEDYIRNCKLPSWQDSWWCFARVFSKTEKNFVFRDEDDADVLAYLQIIVSCNLFSQELCLKAYPVIEIRNSYCHSPNFQLATERLKLQFLTIQGLEELIV